VEILSSALPLLWQVDRFLYHAANDFGYFVFECFHKAIHHEPLVLTNVVLGIAFLLCWWARMLTAGSARSQKRRSNVERKTETKNPSCNGREFNTFFEC
jgi:hypothetical protein